VALPAPPEQIRRGDPTIVLSMSGVSVAMIQGAGLGVVTILTVD
jgi:hypothetical protein